jgi:hypothetical protein
VTAYDITHADLAGWQRRAAAELGRLLAVNRDLPVIAWTVGSAGAVLVGQVGGPAPAAQVRAAFDAWRVALGLGDGESTPWAGAVVLRAAAYRNRVQVTVTATVVDGDEEEAAR